MNLTDKKIRRMYRKSTDKLAYQLQTKCEELKQQNLILWISALVLAGGHIVNIIVNIIARIA